MKSPPIIYTLYPPRLCNRDYRSDLVLFLHSNNHKLCFPKMGKIHPMTPTTSSSSASSSSSSSCYITSKREAFTVWMKSLVMQSNGCTVFNEDGEITYRIDNYDSKCSNEVLLMDLRGNVVFTILRKKLFRRWDGYKCSNPKPSIEVKRSRRMFRDLSYQVLLRSDNGQTSYYRLEALSGKSAFKITDNNGVIVAEANRKQSSSGVLLGDDVLSLTVEPLVDHSLIMAIVTVYGLIQHRL
ncbi:Protein LURP-one-related 11 [Tripterygium wilfordii]|uniref:Protein LURP-one-related 11 n=1 Tax=Tripterygium wilfordii TaxID=458696 RepID=A0A7J7C777_TRIWF|nr:Protein LURP-one-related 11 [Tripterygium wilfordii]